MCSGAYFADFCETRFPWKNATKKRLRNCAGFMVNL